MLSRTLAKYLQTYSGLSRTVWLISFASFINRSGTMVLTFLTIYLTTELGFTMEQASVVMTLFGLGSLTGSYLGGYLTDKIGYNRVLFWSLILGGFLFIALGQIKSIEGVYIFIFLLTAIGDAFRPATMSALAAYSTPETRTRSYSLMRMSINVGFTLGPALGGLIAGWKGYELLFWVDGLTNIAAAIAFRIILDPKKAAVPGSEPAQKDAKPVKASSPFADGQYMLFLLLTTLGAMVFLQIIFTLPKYYEQVMHLEERHIGALLALNGLLVFLLEMPLVFFLERKMKRLNCIIIGVVLYALGYLVLNLSPQSVLVAAMGIVSLSIGEVFNMPFSNSFALSRATEANRGKYMGMYSMTYSLANILGPYFGLQLAAHFGFDTLWYVSGLICVPTILGFMWMKKLNPEQSPVDTLEMKATAVVEASQ